MHSASLCVTCPNRDSGFCGTLLKEPFDGPNSYHQPTWQHFRAARSREQMATRNHVSKDVFVLCTGWAFRFFQLSDGRRQILTFLLPGDLFSAVSIFDKKFHVSVKALTAARISGFERAEVRARCASSPEFQSAIVNACIEETDGANELLTVLGQRSAEERIAYLLLHLMRRIASRNVIRENRYPFPLRQQHIADAVGLTPVHVSRVFSLFRNRDLVELSEGVLSVIDLPELERIGSIA